MEENNKPNDSTTPLAEEDTEANRTDENAGKSRTDAPPTQETDIPKEADSPKPAKNDKRVKKEKLRCHAPSCTSAFIKFLTSTTVRSIEASRIVRGFTHDDKLTKASRESSYLNRFRSGKMRLWLLNQKHSFLSQLENSSFRFGKTAVSSTLMKTPLRYYGAFILSFAAICCFAYWLDFRYLNNLFGISASQPAMCLPLLIIGIALLFLNETPSEYIRSSLILKTIVFKCFGATLKHDDSPTREYHYPTTMLLGGFLGALSVLIPLKILLLFLSFIISIAIILKSPETGVLLTVAAVFFIPFNYTCFIIITTWISFALKFLSGKRVLKFEYIDLCVFFVALIVLGGGIFSLGDKSFSSAILPFFTVSLYFLVAGLIHDRVWANRCRMALCICGTLSSIAVILKKIPQPFFCQSMQIFPTAEYGTQTDSVFQNSGVLILLLTATFFMQLASFYSGKKKSEKTAHLILCILFASAILMWLTPRAAILFTLLTLYATLLMAKGLRFLIPLTVVFWVIAPIFGFPTVSEIFSMAADDVITRHYAWSEYIRLFNTYGYPLLIFGIGLRHDAIADVSTVIFTDKIPGNLLLSAVISLGIPMVAFIMLVIIPRLLKYCLSYCYRCSDKSSASRLYTHGGLMAIAYMLLLGITENIGHNYRCTAFFWLILGLTVSAQRYSSNNTAGEYYNDPAIISEL